ncbi:MAG: hypothetical protein WA651_09075 [Candidatus Sulfotelmatobacter sp.]
MDETDGMISIGGRWWRFPSVQIDGDSWEGEWRSDGKVYLHDGVGNVVEGIEVDNPEVLAVVPLPSAAERRLRELLLARLMLVMVDIVLAGVPLGLETARDLSRELRHAYPELVDECAEP